MEGYVVSSCFAYHDAQIKVLAVLSNTTLAAVCLPSRIPDGSRMDPISDVITKPVYRRIDKGMTLVFSNVHNGDIFVTGDDKFLKKYEFPADPFTKMDFKKPPNAPIEELKSHDLQNTCWDFSNEIKFMATGGKDGNIILRNMN
jgi:WD40 repeat protein